MQISAKDQGEWKWVQRNRLLGSRFNQPRILEKSLPLSSGQIRIRQNDPMWPVADPIHKTKGPMIERIFLEMILDQNVFPRNADCVAHDRERIQGVMQNVDEHASIEALVLER